MSEGEFSGEAKGTWYVPEPEPEDEPEDEDRDRRGPDAEAKP